MCDAKLVDCSSKRDVGASVKDNHLSSIKIRCKITKKEAHEPDRFGITLFLRHQLVP